ncbi:TPA: 50S ribosomal protein L22 [archaeon]|jgi:large subunit ribosomal protein L22|uniref:50S ribosomal protein L22 n=1 Tax=Candidatus Undinarchaeum marinum TaxID=2756141 RepID=A0A832UYN6_9ARCH|nr:50S ribosomal protein L22 [Candidatus Undinarchaeum marinum]
MAKLGYTYQGGQEGIVKALVKSERISPKEAYEVANAIRSMSLPRAETFLSNVMEKKEVVPYRRYNRGVAHRKKIGPGRYPLNTSKGFMKALKLLRANAVYKGMEADSLELFHVATHRGEITPGRYKGGAHNHPTVHIELVAKESVSIQKKEEEKPEEKKVELKTEKKSEEKKAKTEKKSKVKLSEEKSEEKSEKTTDDIISEAEDVMDAEPRTSDVSEKDDKESK